MTASKDMDSRLSMFNSDIAINKNMPNIIIESESNNISHPAHYAQGRKYEPIDVIEDWQLGFSLGNTVKYISRAGRKQDYKGQDQLAKTIQDLEKAKWYLDYAIHQLYIEGAKGEFKITKEEGQNLIKASSQK